LAWRGRGANFAGPDGIGKKARFPDLIPASPDTDTSPVSGRDGGPARPSARSQERGCTRPASEGAADVSTSKAIGIKGYLLFDRSRTLNQHSGHTTKFVDDEVDVDDVAVDALAPEVAAAVAAVLAAAVVEAVVAPVVPPGRWWPPWWPPRCTPAWPAAWDVV